MSDTKLTEAQKRVMKRVRGGCPVMVLPGGGYRFMDGSRCPVSTVRALLRKGALRPAEDGLFAGKSQTLRAE